MLLICHTHPANPIFYLLTDEVVIVGDFNIHVDTDNDSLSVAFISIGFSQCVHIVLTTHLTLSYGVKIEDLST